MLHSGRHGLAGAVLGWEEKPSSVSAFSTCRTAAISAVASAVYFSPSRLLHTVEARLAGSTSMARTSLAEPHRVYYRGQFDTTNRHARPEVMTVATTLNAQSAQSTTLFDLDHPHPDTSVQR